MIKVTVRNIFTGQNDRISAQGICRVLIELMINFTDYNSGGDISGILNSLSGAFSILEKKKLHKPIQAHTHTPLQHWRTDERLALLFSYESYTHYFTLQPNYSSLYHSDISLLH